MDEPADAEVSLTAMMPLILAADADAVELGASVLVLETEPVADPPLLACGATAVTTVVATGFSGVVPPA